MEIQNSEPTFLFGFEIYNIPISDKITLIGMVRTLMSISSKESEDIVIGLKLAKGFVEGKVYFSMTEREKYFLSRAISWAGRVHEVEIYRVTTRRP